MVEWDDRGVSTLVGAILLFGILLVVYATWQAAVVPAENKQVEFDAFQDAGEDVTELRNAIQRAGVTGVQTSTVVQTGTYYPSRVVFVNPPPASGTLVTESAGDVTFANVEATDGDVRDYWDGNSRSFDTNRVVFRSDYNELRTGSLGVDPSGATFLAAEGTVIRDAQTLVSGNRITLVTVAGDYRDGGVTVSPAVEPVSVGTETISVRNTSGDFTMTVPTRLNQDAWTDIADGQATITDATVTDGNVTLTFRDGTYHLRLARVALREPTGGSAVSEPGARYLSSPNREPGPTVEENPVPLTAVVRDEYNNGVSGVDVEFDVTTENANVVNPDGNSCTAVTGGDTTATTASDSSGEAVACLVPPNNGKNKRSVTVDATIAGRSGDANRTSFNVTVFKK